MAICLLAKLDYITILSPRL